MTEGSGSGDKSGSGSIPLTSGSESREGQKHVDPVDPKHWMTVGSKITVSKTVVTRILQILLVLMDPDPDPGGAKTYTGLLLPLSPPLPPLHKEVTKQ
jgi:hypothetical protein